jgi:hypothetical protein
MISTTRQVSKQPGPSQATAADHDSVAASRAHHAQRVLGFPDVAIAEHRNRAHRLLELADRMPAGVAVVELRRGPRVQGHGRAAFLLGDAARSQKGEMRVIDAHAQLDRDRRRAGRADRGAYDLREQLGLERDRGAAAAARDLAHRAAEVEVYVIDAPFADQALDRLADEIGIDSVQLEAARALVGAEAREPQRLVVALDQRARGDHLAHVQACAELTTQRAKRVIGHAGHRREHDRRPNAQRPER